MLPPSWHASLCHAYAHAALMAKALASSTPVLTAPLTCPYYPNSYIATPPTPPPAITAASISLPALLAELHSAAAARAIARASELRTRANRGPPQFLPL